MTESFEPIDVALRNGRHVAIRAIVPSDEGALIAAFEHLGPQSRYMRFMRSVGEPNRERLRAVLASMPERGLALAARDGDEIVGTTMFVVGPDPDTCEFAISVTDAWAGTGLGSTLLRQLIEAARRRGMREIEGIVLAENAPMLRLARKVGFTVSRHPDDFALRLCRLTLASAPA